MNLIGLHVVNYMVLVASVFEKSFGYIKCDKCQAIYKHKMIDLLKFTDRNVLRTPFGKKIDVGSLDVNDIVMKYNLNESELVKLVEQYTFSGLTAKMKFSQWRRFI